MLKFLVRFVEWLFSYREDVWGDKAHAGETPKGFDASAHHIAAILYASLLSFPQDCFIADLSKWDGVVNFITLTRYVQGVIIKVGQGIGLDPRFKEYWDLAKSASLKRGSYWFYDSRVDPKTQALTWWNAIKDDVGELVHFADYEETYLGAYRGIDNFRIFVEEFLRLSKLPDDRFGVYTGYYYWFDNGSNDPFWARFWLWLAWYGDRLDVISPKPWTQERLWGWQYTDHADGHLFGSSAAELDLSYYIQGLEIYESIYGEVAEPTQETGVTGMFNVHSDVYTMSLRDKPSYPDGIKKESYVKGTNFVADAIVPPSSGGLPSDRWAHIISVAGVAKDLYVAIVHNGVTYCTYEEINGQTTNPKIDVVFFATDGRIFEAKGVELHERV
jgi:hypothetical protein